MQLASCLLGIRKAGEDFHLMLVGFQEVDVPQDFVLLRPIDGKDILVAHFAEIAL